jgi:uncharacterized LabA/DUF88 family protein
VSTPRLAVVMDYQNIHLTARDCFSPAGTPDEDVLIHPLLFANRLLQARAARQGDPTQKAATLAAVKVFRGSPGFKEQPFLYGVTQAQRSEWTRDPRVEVNYRTLRYIPGKPTQEKGIDVMVALAFVEAVECGDYDVVVLAAHDTDLEPALDAALRKNRAKVETAGWKDCRRLKPTGRTVWHTALTGNDMVQSRDRKDYSGYGGKR